MTAPKIGDRVRHPYDLEGQVSDLNHPLRLATGSHQAGSGKGCAMNVISWENGDKTISDLPGCADPFLARVVQGVNDAYCAHVTGSGLLCPQCSIDVLALAHRTVGTALPVSVARPVWVQIAREEADSVKHLTARASVNAGDAANEAAYAHASNAAAYAAYASAAEAAYEAANAAWDAASAYACVAVDSARLSTIRMARAHHIIDRFEELTGVRAQPVPTEVTAAAVQRMCEVTA